MLCSASCVWSMASFLHPLLNLRAAARLPDPHSPPFSSFRLLNPIRISLPRRWLLGPLSLCPSRKKQLCVSPSPPADASPSYFLLFPPTPPPGAAVQRHTFLANPAVTSGPAVRGSGGNSGVLQMSPPPGISSQNNDPASTIPAPFRPLVLFMEPAEVLGNLAVARLSLGLGRRGQLTAPGARDC